MPLETDDVELLLEFDNDAITCAVLRHYTDQMDESLVDICIGLLHCRIISVKNEENSRFALQLEYLSKLTQQVS